MSLTFRFALLQALMVTYTHGKKPALRRRAHAIVLSHRGHTINLICNIPGTPTAGNGKMF